eukprot:gene20392-27163_t
MTHDDLTAFEIDAPRRQTMTSDYLARNPNIGAEAPVVASKTAAKHIRIIAKGLDTKFAEMFQENPTDEQQDFGSSSIKIYKHFATTHKLLKRLEAQQEEQQASWSDVPAKTFNPLEAQQEEQQASWSDVPAKSFSPLEAQQEEQQASWSSLVSDVPAKSFNPLEAQQEEQQASWSDVPAKSFNPLEAQQEEQQASWSSFRAIVPAKSFNPLEAQQESSKLPGPALERCACQVINPLEAQQEEQQASWSDVPAKSFNPLEAQQEEQQASWSSFRAMPYKSLKLLEAQQEEQQAFWYPVLPVITILAGSFNSTLVSGFGNAGREYDGGKYAMLLRQDGQPVSACTFNVYSTRVPAQISLVATLEEERGLGHCTALNEVLEMTLKDLGVPSVVMQPQRNTLDMWIKKFGYSVMHPADAADLHTLVPLAYYDTPIVWKPLTPSAAAAANARAQERLLG